VRLSHGNEQPAVQVVDLPGGNHRYADFILGVSSDAPKLTFVSPRGSVPAEAPGRLAVTVSGLTETEIREMWLHVRTAEGIWRRYPMKIERAQGAIQGVTDFPVAAIGSQSHSTFYVSAMTPVGDEYYTELASLPIRKGARAKSPTTP
jgi:hypothetical protein